MPANFPPSDEAIESAIDSVIQATDQEFVDDESLTHAGLPTAEATDSEPNVREGLSVVATASLFTDERHCHPDPVHAAERLDDLHFAMLGLRTNESRLLTIRRAVQRSTGALASVQIATPSTVNECHLARVATAAYRVMDPRFRTDRHQQVQLGRILAHALESVSCSSFASEASTIPPTSTELAEMAILASEPTGNDDEAWVQPAGPVLSLNQPTIIGEQELVFAEMRGRQGRLKRWLADARTLIGLVVLFLIATFYSAWWMGARQADKSPIRVAREKHQSIPTYPKFSEPFEVANELDALGVSGNQQDSESTGMTTGSSEIATSDSATKRAAAEKVDMKTGADASDLSPNLPDDSIPELETFAKPELKTIASVGDVSNASPLNLDWSDIDPQAIGVIETTLPMVSEMDSTFNGSESVLAKSFTNAEIETAAKEYWDQTEGVIRRFGLAGASELIGEWERMGELAGPGSLELMASSRLCLRASWFAESIHQTIDRTETHVRQISADGISITSTWSDEMVGQLVQSWRDARSNVSTTEDLNHLLIRGNGLLDQLVLHEQFAWCSSVGLEIERLASFTTETDPQQDLVDLMTSVKLLPGKVELERMRESEASRGLFGRILCLQFRRWDEGLPLLCDASDSRLSSLAKLETQWVSDHSDALDDNTTTTQSLGDLALRWSKIANRYNGREAAAIRLHALELMNGLDGFESEREEIQSMLPSYLSLPSVRPVAQSYGGKSLRLSRLK